MLSWRALPACTLFHIFSLLAKTGASPTAASKVAQSTPAPLVIPPSQFWDGNDGPWSSFFLRVGSPAQSVRVLISTASNQPLVVLPQGCFPESPSDCQDRRGGVFQTNASSTWAQNTITPDGIFTLGIEQNLGLSANARYGTDTVSLSYLGSGMPSLVGQNVGGITNQELFMGIFGLNPAATNFSTFNNPVPSYMSHLKTQNLIPSLSYAYTAGAQYRFNKVLGSLILGGYDESLLIHNNLSFQFDADTAIDLTVNIQSITSRTKEDNKTLSFKPFPAFVDSTIPYLYLPLEVCQRFEDAFGITYDTTTSLYLVNETLHTRLLEHNANITFTLTNSTGLTTIDIVLPYAAFDLQISWPLVQNPTRYFPLKRAANNTQNTLGRAFLQEAYLISNYETSSFSISQRGWDANLKPSIRTILPLNAILPTTPKHIPTPTIIASCLCGAVFITVLTGFAVLIFQRQRRLKLLALHAQSHSPRLHMQKLNTSTSPSLNAFDPISPFTIQKSELEAHIPFPSQNATSAPPHLDRVSRFESLEQRVRSEGEIVSPLGNDDLRPVRGVGRGGVHEMEAREPVGWEMEGEGCVERVERDGRTSPVEEMLQSAIDEILRTGRCGQRKGERSR